MADVVIIGGGFAGLTAAVHLIKKNISVELIEASPKLGGRAYSISIPEKEDYFDNGQHIMMGCYTDTLEFLEIIGAADKVEIQNNLSVKFVSKNGSIYNLSADCCFYPFNLINGIYRFEALSRQERIDVIKFFGRLVFTNKGRLKNLTVADWLNVEKQSQNSIKAFWEILVVGTLNSSIHKASAEIFCEVLVNVFLKGSKAASIVLPKTGLSEMYCSDAEKFISSNGGKISLSEKIEKVIFENEKIVEIQTNKRNLLEFKYLVSAVPYYSFEKIFPTIIDFNEEDWEHSTILSIHIWLSENPFKEKFYGLIDSKIHWLFNHPKHISLVISDANELVFYENEKIFDIACSELEKYFSIFNKKLITGYKVIKEKRATFIPTMKNSEFRKTIEPFYSNLFIAGDWTTATLPATIEAAVKSGKLAASGIIEDANY